MTRWIESSLAAAALCVAAESAFAEQMPSDWSALLKRDAQALHDLYLENHPGAVDPENPAFRDMLQAGLEQALARAERAGSYPAYWWAMREYVARFNDGHVNIDGLPATPKIPANWPGFLTREAGGEQVVAARIEQPDLPSLGSTLVACDGVPASDLMEDVGRFRGRWNLASQREMHGWRLFIDAANPYVKRPTSCIFKLGHEQKSYQLRWLPMPDQLFQAEVAKVMARRSAAIEARPFGEAGLWIAASSFNSDETSEAGRALKKLVAWLKENEAKLASAETIVLDVRGNSGGSSFWGNRIAAAIWGEKNARAAKPTAGGIDWRASPGNISALSAWRDQPGTGMQMRVWASHMVAGMRRAAAEGRQLWRETPVLGGLFSGGKAADGIHPRAFKTKAAVFVLTDGYCASACLDAVDLWTWLGAIPIRRETSADSLYMEVRSQTLPSGLAKVTVPMKVWRGRPRGSNEPYRPVHAFKGDMADQQALERWIESLPRPAISARQ